MLQRPAHPDVEEPSQSFVVGAELGQDDDRPLEALEAADRIEQDRVGRNLRDEVGGEAQRVAGVVVAAVPEDLVAEAALAPGR